MTTITPKTCNERHRRTSETICSVYCNPGCNKTTKQSAFSKNYAASGFSQQPWLTQARKQARPFAVGDAFTGIGAMRKDRCAATNARVYPSKRVVLRSGAQEPARRVHDHDSPCQVSRPGQTVGHERDSRLPASRSLSASVSERQRVRSVRRGRGGERRRGRQRGSQGGMRGERGTG